MFTTADARAVGLGTKGLQRLVRSGAVTKLCHHRWMRGTPRDARDLHRACSLALGVDFEGTAWLSHHSALVVADLPVHPRLLPRVHLTRWRDSQTRRTPAYVLHAGADLDEPTRLAIAVVQTALIGPPLSALYAADAALRARLFQPAHLDGALTRLTRRRGMAPARAVLVHADRRHESPGETRTAAILRALGYRATPQVELRRDGQSYWVDFLLEGSPVVIEFDGRVKYVDPAALWAEKRREDELRSWGYVVVRLTWGMLDDPERGRDRIESAVRSVRPG